MLFEDFWQWAGERTCVSLTRLEDGTYRVEVYQDQKSSRYFASTALEVMQLAMKEYQDGSNDKLDV
jgi:hypothetical protein